MVSARPVERSKIDRAIAVASQAPSACNRQPFVFRVFDDPELVEKCQPFRWGQPDTNTTFRFLL